MSLTLQQKINTKFNDYSKIEDEFKAKTGLELVTTNDQGENDVECNEHISLVISCYMGGKTLPLMFERLEKQDYKNFEVIIVDDGSPINIFPLIKKLNPGFSTKFIKQTTNRGRSFTRNTGMLASGGKSIIFTDQDIIFDSKFMLRFAIRQFYTTNSLYIGFKEDIGFGDLTKIAKANLKSDWRYSVKGEKFFIPLYPDGTLPDDPEREYRILSETDNLKKLGFGRTMGFWNLPSMIISHGLCVKREAALLSGGFPEEGFEGWGAQDIAFGARLIGGENFVIPVINNVYFHIAHERYSGSREKELGELKDNLKTYFTLLGSVKYNSSPRHREIQKTGRYKNIEIYEVN